MCWVKEELVTPETIMQSAKHHSERTVDQKSSYRGGVGLGTRCRPRTSQRMDSPEGMEKIGDGVRSCLN
jgi:hypothetical protein